MLKYLECKLMVQPVCILISNSHKYQSDLRPRKQSFSYRFMLKFAHYLQAQSNHLMDKQYAQTYKLLNQWHIKAYDLLSVLGEIQLSAISPDTINERILKSSMLYCRSGQGPYVICYHLFYGLKNIPVHMKLLDTLGQIHTIFTLYLWELDFDEEVLIRLRRATDANTRHYIFTECKVGHRLQRYLSIINLQNIQQLQIASDPLDNKCFKLLAKLELPFLRFIGFQNTNLTTDFMNTLPKLIAVIQYFQFKGHQKAISTVIVKKAAPFLCQSDKSNFIYLTPCFQPQDSFYGCCPVKSSSPLTVVRIYAQKQNQFPERYPIDKSFLMPPRTFAVMKEYNCYF